MYFKLTLVQYWFSCSYIFGSSKKGCSKKGHIDRKLWGEDTLTVKWPPFQFLARFIKNLFYWLTLLNFTNISHLLILMCLMQAQGNKAVAYSGYENFDFTINVPLKMLLHRFRHAHFPNFIVTFIKYFLKNCHFLM